LKPKFTIDISSSFDKKLKTFCFIQLLSFLAQRKDKIQILERSLGFVKIYFQAEDFFNFLIISSNKYDLKNLAKIMDRMHLKSSQLIVFSKTPV